MSFFKGSYLVGLGAVAILKSVGLKKAVCLRPQQDGEVWNPNWDNRAGGPRPQGNPVRHFLLVRHGQYHMKDAQGNNLRNDRDKRLTQTGEEQAQRVGRYLFDKLDRDNLELNKVISSRLTRAVQTADIAMENYSMYVGNNRGVDQRDPNLNECRPIRPEPQELDNARIYNTPQGQRQVMQAANSMRQVVEDHFGRADLASDGQVDVIFCHANVIRYLTMRLLQLPVNAWLNFKYNHGGVTHITIDANGVVKCEALSDHGHLPAFLLTTS